MFELLNLTKLGENPYREEAMSGKNDIGAKLRFAALHGCETKWKQCGAPKKGLISKKGLIDRFGIPEDGS